MTLEQLREVLPAMQPFRLTAATASVAANPPTPGLKYKHYAPHAELTLLEGSDKGQLHRAVAAYCVRARLADLV